LRKRSLNPDETITDELLDLRTRKRARLFIGSHEKSSYRLAKATFPLMAGCWPVLIPEISGDGPCAVARLHDAGPALAAQKEDRSDIEDAHHGPDRIDGSSKYQRARLIQLVACKRSLPHRVIRVDRATVTIGPLALKQSPSKRTFRIGSSGPIAVIR
jgi:hypothetical protein